MPTGRHVVDTTTGRKLVTTTGRLATDCAPVGCECSGPVPTNWIAEISGLTNSSCVTCTAIDGVYFPTSVSSCAWTTTSSECSVTITHTLAVVVVDASNVKVRYTLDFTGGDTIVFESGNILKTVACCDIDSETLTHVSGDGGGRCVATSATVEVSAICPAAGTCHLCDDTTTPQFMKVIVPANEFPGDFCTGAECSILENTTFILAPHFTLLCSYFLNIGSLCNGGSASVEVHITTSGSDIIIQCLFLMNCGLGGTIRYEGDTGVNTPSTIDCLQIDQQCDYVSQNIDCCGSAQTSVQVQSL